MSHFYRKRYNFVPKNVTSVNIKTLLTAILTTVSIGSAHAESDWKGGLKADFVSRYIWRGLHQGHVAVQPELSVGWKGLSLSAWGNVPLSAQKEDFNEIDLTLSYETGGLSFGVIDYWNDENDKRFFYFKKNGTGHSVEGFVGYDFGPVSASWQTFFAGNDYKESNGKRAFSSYFELQVPFRFVTCDWEGTVGLVPWASDYYSTNGFSVTNVSLKATKDIKITKSFSLPLFANIIANPSGQHLYFVAGFTLKAF